MNTNQSQHHPDPSRQRQTVDAEFEVVEIETVDEEPTGNSTFAALKQSVMKAVIITVVVVTALLLLWLAFYLFLAFVLVLLVLRLFGVGRGSTFEIHTGRFRR